MDAQTQAYAFNILWHSDNKCFPHDWLLNIIMHTLLSCSMFADRITRVSDSYSLSKILQTCDYR